MSGLIDFLGVVVVIAFAVACAIIVGTAMRGR